MIGGVQNIGRVPELQRRILFTFAMLGVYRIGAYVATPGINPGVIKDFFAQAQDTMFGLFNLFKLLLINPLGGVFLGAFFCVHFGMFMFVHGVFLTAFFFTGLEGGIDEHPFILLETVRWEILVLIFSHGFSFRNS